MTDTSVTGGAPGIMTFGTAKADNWVGGGAGSSPPTYSVGGSVSGLSGTVVLQDNGGDDLSVSAQRAVHVSRRQLVSRAAYAVTVKTQPVGQTCSVSNGSGTVGSANVTSVAVTCTTTPTYSVGGTVSGLAGTVVLQDNGGDDLSRHARTGRSRLRPSLPSGAGLRRDREEQPDRPELHGRRAAPARSARRTSPTSRSPARTRRCRQRLGRLQPRRRRAGRELGRCERWRACRSPRRRCSGRARRPVTSGRRDIPGRSVVADRGDLDPAVGRAVDRAGGADAERRPGHVSRASTSGTAAPSSSALQAQRRHLDPARKLVQLRRRWPPGRSCS